MSIDQRCRSIVFDKKGTIEKKIVGQLDIFEGKNLTTMYYFRFVIMCTMKNDPLLMMTTAALNISSLDFMLIGSKMKSSKEI